MGKSKAKSPSPVKDNLSDVENTDEAGPEVILDVTCGPNKAEFYLHRLKMGSKGTSVLFENSWFTPNGFQFVSGRGTAKDWKRSIKHHGRSLKLLMAKGLVTVTPPCCMCEICLPDGPEAREKAALAAAQEAGEITPKKKSKETLAERRASNDGVDSIKNKLKVTLKAKGCIVPAEEMSDPTIQRDENMSPNAVVFPAPVPVTEDDEEMEAEGETEVAQPISSPQSPQENACCAVDQEKTSNADSEKDKEENNNATMSSASSPKQNEEESSEKKVEDVMASEKDASEDVMDCEPPTLKAEVPETNESGVQLVRDGNEDSSEGPPDLPMDGGDMEGLTVQIENLENRINEEEEGQVLSPHKEKRLTSIIDELKSYKKKLIEKIEVTRRMPHLTEQEGKGVSAEVEHPRPPTSPEAATSPRPAQQASPTQQQSPPPAPPLPYPFSSSGLSPTMLTAASLDKAIHQSQALYAYYNQLYAWAARQRSGPAAALSPSTAATTATITPTPTPKPTKPKRSRKSVSAAAATSITSPSSSTSSSEASKSLLGSYLSCQCHTLGYKDSHAPSCLVYHYSRIYPPMYSSSLSYVHTSPSYPTASATASSSSAATTSTSSSTTTTTTPKATPVSTSSPSSSALSSKLNSTISADSSHTLHYKTNQDSIATHRMSFPTTIPQFSPSKGLGFTNGYAYDKDGALDLTSRKRAIDTQVIDSEQIVSPVKKVRATLEKSIEVLDLSVKK